MTKFQALLGGLAAMGAVATSAPANAQQTWSGIYVGGHIGYGITDVGRHLVAEDAVNISAITPAYSIENDGLVAGGQFGIQRQFDRVVAGLEVSVSGGQMRGDRDDVNFFGTHYVDCVTPGFSCRTSSDIRWISTITGRLGVTVQPNWLVYGKAGYAVAGVDAELRAPFNNQERTVWKASDLHHGWTVGIGVENKFMSNVSWGLEYNFVALDEGTHSNRYRTFNVPANVLHDRVSVDDIHTITARLNFHLNHGASAAAPLK